MFFGVIRETACEIFTVRAVKELEQRSSSRNALRISNELLPDSDT
jgi:hypothetical protein